MDVIIYNRISTDNKDQDPESNLNKSKEFCKYNNHKVIKIILDKGVSGDSYYYDREQGREIDQIKEIYQKKGKALGVVVFSIDRFTRQHPVKALSVIQNLKDDGVSLFSATENIFNEESEFSLPMQFMIVWFNYYFLLQHSKKVKAGMEKRKALGLNIGRGILKEIKFKGTKKEEKVYYSGDELKGIHNLIKVVCNQNSYRSAKVILKRDFNIDVSIGYMSKVLNEK